MKRIVFSILAAAVMTTACVDLDLTPKSQGSSENWYSTEQELQLSLNALYNPTLWNFECNRLFHTDRYSDDWSQRTELYDWLAGSVADDWAKAKNEWANDYKGIARANTILNSLEKTKDELSEATVQLYSGEAKFFRASFYTYLVFLFGDVPFYTDYITLEEAYKMGRTDRYLILDQIYQDLDDAAAALPVSYNGAQRVTKGAALAMKARAALLMNDWKTCAAAAKACMDLGVYSLHPDYRELFLSSCKTSPEFIFALPCSNELAKHSYGEAATRSFYPRNNGGTSVAQPSWELFFAYPCTDGKSVEESPLYDPANPFANRDPRLSEITAPFDVEFMDYIYNPRPSAKQTLKVSTGTMVKNNDSRLNSKDCSYNGLILKKYVDEEWIDDRLTDTPQRILRYADVLLMYAESKMELNEIDKSVFDALNSLRARAYKCGINETSKYPAISETSQKELRRIIRNERRCELAWENRRWSDLIRWRICEPCLTAPIYGLPANAQIEKNEATGYWIWPKDFRPHMREDTTIDLSDIENYPEYYQINVKRAFNPRQYLFPIPQNERVVCPMLTQNPGY